MTAEQGKAAAIESMRECQAQLRETAQCMAYSRERDAVNRAANDLDHTIQAVRDAR